MAILGQTKNLYHIQVCAYNEIDFLFSFTEMIENIKANGFPLQRMQDGPNETSKTYKVDGFCGSVGFITSMSDHFCSTCNRIRMMADGAIKVCLFGPNEISLRDIMRSGGSDDE